MRTTLFLSIAVLATALAGCSDDPAAGTFAFESSAATAGGSVENAQYTAFSPAYDQTSGTQAPDCPAQPEDDPSGMLPLEYCTYASTVIDANLTDLPDPQGGTYAIFFVDSSGTNPAEKASDLENVHEMGGAWMGEFHYDNSEQCDGMEGDSATQECKKDEKYDTLEVRLGDVPLASSGMGSGSSFAVLPMHSAVSFEGSYSGKDFTVTVSGLNSNLTYEGWLITETEGGAEHAESFSVSNGENTYEAEMAGDSYTAFHIHVTGTKINVAVGPMA